MKVCLLIPCLMQTNNRKVNFSGMQYAKDHYGVDEIIVEAQGFEETDYVEGFTYIGNHPKGIGFTGARNALLKWFYNSDYDWAVWMDAKAKVSKPTLNDFRTVLDAIRNNKVNVDVILSTLGMYISGSRIDARRREDHKDVVYLVQNADAGGFLGLFMVNLKKKYGLELYIDERCDPRVGISEDFYFVRLVKRLLNVRECPTIVISEPSNKHSTWIADKKGYEYYPVDYKTLDAIIDENIKKNCWEKQYKDKKTYVLKRVDLYKDLVKSWEPPKNIKRALLR